MSGQILARDQASERIVETAAESAVGLLNRALGSHLRGKAALEVLEAGGGSNSKIAFDPSQKVVITTIDISPEQIEKNAYATHKILGDLCAYKFAPRSFDLIVCYDVIEHLADPQAAIESFITSIRPGGYIVIGAPDPRSLKGAITKYTPHSLHVFFYKAVGNDPNAGKPGYAPFPTTMKYCIAPDNLAERFRKAGFEIVYLNAYDTGYIRLIRSKFRLLGGALDAAVSVLKTIFGGKYKPELSDFHLIARMPAQAE